MLVMANAKSMNCLAQIRPAKDAKFVSSKDGYTLAIIGPVHIQIGAMKVLENKLFNLNPFLAPVQASRPAAASGPVSAVHFAQEIELLLRPTPLHHHHQSRYNIHSTTVPTTSRYKNYSLIF